MNFADAVERVLKEDGKPMSIADITKRALELGIITPKSDQPTTYVRAAIRKANRQQEVRGEKPRFVRTPDGQYAMATG